MSSSLENIIVIDPGHADIQQDRPLFDILFSAIYRIFASLAIWFITLATLLATLYLAQYYTFGNFKGIFVTKYLSQLLFTQQSERLVLDFSKHKFVFDRDAVITVRKFSLNTYSSFVLEVNWKTRQPMSGSGGIRHLLYGNADMLRIEVHGTPANYMYYNQISEMIRDIDTTRPSERSDLVLYPSRSSPSVLYALHKGNQQQPVIFRCQKSSSLMHRSYCKGSMVFNGILLATYRFDADELTQWQTVTAFVASYLQQSYQSPIISKR